MRIKKNKKISLIVALSLLSALLFASPTTSGAAGIEYYVAVTGDDNGAGTIDNPFRTVARASTVAQPGDTVVIREGIYNEGLYPRNSGEAGAPIIYKSYDGEVVEMKLGTTGLSNGGYDSRDNATMNASFGVYMYDKSYIVIENLRFDLEGRLGRIVESDNITIRGCYFSRNNYNVGTAHGLLFENSHYNIIENNFMTFAYDILVLIQSDYNLIQNNVMTNADHTLWVIRAGSYNVIRNNYFHNERQKIGEIYDNGAWSALADITVNDGAGARFGDIAIDSAKHNIVENNIFAFTPYKNATDGPFSGIQFDGQQCIIRNNIFADCQGPGLSISPYNDEAMYDYDNRIYNNTFAGNHWGGIELPRRSSQSQPHNGYPDYYYYYNNLFKNNILAYNDYQACGNSRHAYDGWISLRGHGVQISGVHWDGFKMIGNAIYSNDPDYAWGHGDGAGSGNDHYSIAWLQTAGNYPYSNMYKRNIADAAPEFVNFDNFYNLDPSEKNWEKGDPTLKGQSGYIEYAPSVPFAVQHDFALADGSSLIGAGEWLTFTTPGQDQFSAGSGMNATGWYSVPAGGNQNNPSGPSLSSVISLQDPLYFSDGFGIVEGDLIITELGDTARILDMQYGLGFSKLTLDRDIRERVYRNNRWEGVGIALYAENDAIAGTKPMMGVEMSRITGYALEDLYNKLK